MLMARRPEESGFNSRQEKEIFLFSVTFISALVPTQPSNQWMTGDISPGNKAIGA
jgi:hypothetical protein